MDALGELSDASHRESGDAGADAAAEVDGLASASSGDEPALVAQQQRSEPATASDILSSVSAVLPRLDHRGRQ
eukprot:1102625-Alexandrium_andersonii.AAC.1